MNGSTDVGSMYFDQINTCARLNINYSELMPSGYSYVYPSYGQQVANAIASTNGMNATYSTNSAIQVFNHIYTYAAPPQVKFDAIVPTGWKTIILDGILDENNSVNSDTDDLTDWEEVVTDKLSWDTDGSVFFCQQYSSVSIMQQSHMLRMVYQDSSPLNGFPACLLLILKYLNYILNSTYILPIYSDPTDEDTDGDGLLDGTATYINKGKDNEKSCSKDPNPFKSNGPENAWKAHIEQIENGELVHRLF